MRDTVIYQLKDGRKVVYIGITNNPERREREHCLDGKKFSHMKVVSIRRMTKAGAKTREAKRLALYRKNQGKIPHITKILTVKI